MALKYKLTTSDRLVKDGSRLIVVRSPDETDARWLRRLLATDETLEEIKERYVIKATLNWNKYIDSADLAAEHKPLVLARRRG